MVTYTEESDSDDEGDIMPLLIYPEDSDNKEYPSNPPSTEPTPEPTPPSEKTTKEPTSEPNYDALSEPSAPTMEGYMGKQYPKDIVRYQKWSDPPRLATIEDRTKEDPWGDTWKPRILVKNKSPKAGEYLLTLN